MTINAYIDNGSGHHNGPQQQQAPAATTNLQNHDISSLYGTTTINMHSPFQQLAQNWNQYGHNDTHGSEINNSIQRRIHELIRLVEIDQAYFVGLNGAAIEASEFRPMRNGIVNLTATMETLLEGTMYYVFMSNGIWMSTINAIWIPTCRYRCDNTSATAHVMSPNWRG